MRKIQDYLFNALVISILVISMTPVKFFRTILFRVLFIAVLTTVAVLVGHSIGKAGA